MGYVKRDATDKVIITVSQIKTSVEESETIESLAIFKGVQICANMEILNLMAALQTDSILNSSLGILH